MSRGTWTWCLHQSWLFCKNSRLRRGNSSKSSQISVLPAATDCTAMLIPPEPSCSGHGFSLDSLDRGEDDRGHLGGSLLTTTPIHPTDAGTCRPAGVHVPGCPSGQLGQKKPRAKHGTAPHVLVGWVNAPTSIPHPSAQRPSLQRWDY